MPRDVEACSNPDVVVTGKHVEEPGHRGRPSGPPCEAAVQADRHHAPALRVQDAERILEIAIELLAGIEPLRSGKAHVIDVQRVGNHQLRRLERRVPVREIVGIAVCAVGEPALFRNQAMGVWTAAAEIPAVRPLPGHPLVDFERLLQVRAFRVLVDMLVIDPPVTV